MPLPFRKFGRKINSLFRSRSRDGYPRADRPAIVGEAVPSSSAPSSTTASPVPLVVVTPTRSTVDLGGKPPVPGRYRLSHALTHPSIESGDSGSTPERPSFGPGVLTPGSHSLSSGALCDDRTSAPRALGEPWVHELPPAYSSTRSSPTPSMNGTSYGSPSSPTPPSLGPSCFSNAHDFAVSNLTINNSSAYAKTLFEYLNPHIAHGAAHDSDERWNAPACHEETRVAIREDIVSWVKHGEGDEDPKRMMWLSGPAGSGKTAIAGSVAETCKEEGLLAATFFFSSFSGSAERSSKRGLIATLAYHMSQNDSLHQFKSHLHAAVDRQPNIFRKNLKEQAKCLILEPFRKVYRDQESRVGWPKVVIIDGLDEVVATQHHASMDYQLPATSEDDQVEILQVLLTLSKDPFFPFRILVASRPERNIADFFSDDATGAAVNLFLDSRYQPDTDIRRFLESKFAGIRRRAGILSPLWPGDNSLNRLVEMSSGQFIVPVTIIRWVESGLPRQQLNDVLNLVGVGNKNPFATLDALYRHILKRALNPDNDPRLVTKWILSISSAVRNSMATPTIMFWRGFLEDEEGELNYRLAPIASLIFVPPPNNTSSVISIYHKSLTDFLSSPTRCGDLYVDEERRNCYVADRIVLVLKYKGPIARLASPTDLVAFLEAFIWLELLLLGFTQVSADSLRFLDFLSEGSKAELASCDVAWWTAASLSGLYMDLPHNALTADSSSDEEPKGWKYKRLVQGIYWRIHKTMRCDSNALSLTEHPMGPYPGSQCHQGCMKWRTEIRAKAKELGWCVHQLDEVQPHEVHNLEWPALWQRFKEPDRHVCSICIPLVDQ